MEKEVLEKKAKEYAKKIKTNNLYEEIENSSNTYIVSASFEVYVKYLFKEPIKVFGSNLSFKDDKVESLLFNCYKENKKILLKKQKILKIDTFFTDSYSDKALAEIADRIVVVKGDTKMYMKDFDDFKRYFKR